MRFRANRNIYKKGGIITLFIFVIAFLLRIYNINKYDLWFDELSTSEAYFWHMYRSLPHSLARFIGVVLIKLSGEVHSALYYFLVMISSIFTDGDRSLRLLSVAFSMAALIIFYRFCKMFLDKKERYCAVMLLAINPFHVWYAQEARVYAASSFACILTVYLYMKAIKKSNRLYWVLFSIAAIFSLYLNFFSILLFLVLIFIALLEEDRRYLKKFFMVLIFIFAAFLPIIPVLIRQFNTLRSGFWILTPDISSVILSFAVFGLGYSSNYIYHIVGVLLFFSLYSFGVYTYYKKNKKYTIILVALLFIPIILAYILSISILKVYIIKQLLIFSFFYYIFVAKGIMAINNLLYRLVIVTSVVLLSLASLNNYYSGFITPPLINKKNPNICDDTLYIGVHKKKNYSSLLTNTLKYAQDNTPILATDFQSEYMVRSFLWRHRPDKVSYLYSIFIPSLVDKYEASYLISSSGESKEISHSKDLYLSYRNYYPRKHIFIKFQELLKFRFDNFFVVSSLWGEKDCYVYNSSPKVRQIIFDNFKRIYIKENDGVTVELYSNERIVGEK